MKNFIDWYSIYWIVPLILFFYHFSLQNKTSFPIRPIHTNLPSAPSFSLQTNPSSSPHTLPPPPFRSRLFILWGDFCADMRRKEIRTYLFPFIIWALNNIGTLSVSWWWKKSFFSGEIRTRVIQFMNISTIVKRVVQFSYHWINIIHYLSMERLQ